MRFDFAEKSNKFFYNFISVFLVFNAVCFSNIFFRASSVGEAFQLINNVFSNFIPLNWLVDFVAPLAIGGHQREQFNGIITIAFPLLFLLFERRINEKSNAETISVTYTVVCVLLIMLFGIFNNAERFIYMQF